MNRLVPIFLTLLIAGCSTNPPEIDILISNGLIYDGSEESAFYGYVGIVDEKIALVTEERPQVQPKKEIDAKGYVIAPGFIDPHTHANADLNDSMRSDHGSAVSGKCMHYTYRLLYMFIRVIACSVLSL